MKNMFLYILSCLALSRICLRLSLDGIRVNSTHLENKLLVKSQSQIQRQWHPSYHMRLSKS